MRFNGEWLTCDDGFVRPIIRAEIMKSNGGWWPFEMLIDTGADRSVISVDVLDQLQFELPKEASSIGGAGGIFEITRIKTVLRLTRDDGAKTTFRSEYAACTDHESLDMSVLGRDILDMFALIVERKSNTIAIIGGQHRFVISQS